MRELVARLRHSIARICYSGRQCRTTSSDAMYRVIESLLWKQNDNVTLSEEMLHSVEHPWSMVFANATVASRILGKWEGSMLAEYTVSPSRKIVLLLLKNRSSTSTSSAH